MNKIDKFLDRVETMTLATEQLVDMLEDNLKVGVHTKDCTPEQPTTYLTMAKRSEDAVHKLRR